MIYLNRRCRRFRNGRTARPRRRAPPHAPGRRAAAARPPPRCKDSVKPSHASPASAISANRPGPRSDVPYGRAAVPCTDAERDRARSRRRTSAPRAGAQCGSGTAAQTPAAVSLDAERGRAKRRAGPPAGAVARPRRVRTRQQDRTRLAHTPAGCRGTTTPHPGRRPQSLSLSLSLSLSTISLPLGRTIVRSTGPSVSHAST